jgi:5-formyltetrahydrofolate cyclo-ligase
LKYDGNSKRDTEINYFYLLKKHMNKKEVRQKYKGKRQELNAIEIDDLSLAIANKVLTLPIWEKTYFHIFLPITEQKEVNTEFVLHLLSGKDKEIVVAKSNFKNLEMTHFLLTDATQIKKNQYHIPEPMDGIEVSTQKIEVVFVPLLAFDKLGNRVGYGKGFYDKFLAQCLPETIKIGFNNLWPTVVMYEEMDQSIKSLLSLLLLLYV